MKVAEVVQEYWNEKAAKAYDSICYIDAEKMRNVLLSHLEVDKNEIILDFGTGPGALVLMLAESGYKKIIGLDISEGMLKRAKEKLRDYPVKLVRGDGLHLPIDDNSVGAVVSRWVLWVMPDPERVIEEMIRVTKPSGLVLTFTSGSFDDKKTFWKKLLRFPLGELHHAYMILRFRLSPLRTKKFWRETEGKLPIYSIENYVQIFKQKGLQSVKRTEKEEYGTLCAKLFFGGSKFSLIKGYKPSESASYKHVSSFKSEEWGMNELLKILICPDCHGNIKKIEENKLVCERCNRNFPIFQGIPNLLPTEDRLL